LRSILRLRWPNYLEPWFREAQVAIAPTNTINNDLRTANGLFRAEYGEELMTQNAGDQLASSNQE